MFCHETLENACSVLQQGVVACHSGYIPAEGDQPDGETNVPIFGVGIEHGSGDVWDNPKGKHPKNYHTKDSEEERIGSQVS